MRRTDVWAFGVVLFEMLTGRQLFGSETVSDSIAAVLTREPDFAALPPDTPANVRALLARDLKDRLRDIGEVRHQLEHTTSTVDSAPMNLPSASTALTRGRKIGWLAAAAGVVLIVLAALLWQRREHAIALPAASTSPAAPTQSIAVLPFVNQSGNSDDEYFSDGMTDELANALMKVNGLRVAAHRLGPLDGDAQSRLAAVRWWYAWDVAAAEEEFCRALQLNPNSMDAHYVRSWFLCSLKRWDEGLAETERAIALDPLSPIPSWVREYCFCMSRRFDDALAQHKKTSELDPNFFYVDSPAAIAYREKGMFAESVAEYQRLGKVTGQPMPGLAVAYARMGKTSEARNILREMLDLAAHRYVSPDLVAVIYANLGEKDQAFVWLEKAYEARSAWLITGILVLPQYDPIRDDPRYTALLRKMRLEK